MHRISIASHLRYTFAIVLIFSLLAGTSFTGCQNKQTSSKPAETSPPETPRNTLTEVLSPQASGTEVYGNDSVSIDASNTTEGYFMVCYKGNADKSRIQVTTPDGTLYSYCLVPGDYETFPLSGGNGDYQIDVYEHAYENKYALSYSQAISVTLEDEFKPFLYPNQYVWFTQDSEAVQYGMELSAQSTDDLNYVEQVYNYVIKNITYDTNFAEDIPTDYIPDINETMRTHKGICFDYASLMSALLRSQGIPTKLVVGYSGTAYHAWISVYLDEAGWVDNIIEFDGKDWSLMDPTLAASNDEDSVKKYVGDGSNYIVKYSY